MSPRQFYGLVEIMPEIENLLYGENGMSPVASKRDLATMAASFGIQGPR